MRILFLTTHLNIGGIATYVVSLAKALKNRGHNVMVVSSGGALTFELSNYGISHIQLDIMTKSEISPKVFKATFELIRLAKSLDTELIHANTRVTQVIANFIFKFCKVPFVSTCHGFFEKRFSRLAFPCWGERVIAISEAVLEHLMKDLGVKRERVSLIYNGIDVQKFLREMPELEKDKTKERLGLKKDKFTIGTISRLTPDKGYDNLLYAVYELLKKESNFQLLIVGDGKFKTHIQDLSQRLNIEDRIVFVRPQINTAPILNIVDVFVFSPKRKEGLGLALLEAMAAGRPVVATKVGGIISIVQDGINGFLVEPNNPNSLAEAIYNILKNREIAQGLGQNARRTVVERFSLDGMAEKIEEVYLEVARSCKRLQEVAKSYR